MNSLIDQPSQSRWRLLGLGLAGLLALALAAFLSLFLYYLWITRFGTPEQQQQLAGKFSDQFTQIPGILDRTIPLPDDFSAQTYIYQTTPVLGPKDAPVTVLAFIDFECPYCRQAYPGFAQVMTEFEGVVHIAFKHFPVDIIHPRATAASVAAHCAQQTGQFWPYYEQLFTHNALTDSALQSYASTLGILTPSYIACLDDVTNRSVINQDIQDGIDLGVRGTPTYIINNQKVEGVTELADWREVILQALNSN